MKSGNGPARSIISPCLVVESIEEELEFLRAVFHLTGVETAEHDGRLWQLEANLGDTTLKIGRPRPNDSPMSCVLYVWTDDLDGTFARAIEAGATLISEPTDQPWGVREAGFRAPQGTMWWIGKRMGKMSHREVEEKLRLQRRTRL